jgi:nicotinate-nucleotide adenylyltransferase
VPAEAPQGWRWLHVEVPRVEVSSTDLRARAVDGRPLDYLVTHEVVDWIEANHLYREGS